MLALIISLQGCAFSARYKDQIHTRVDINSPELVVYKAPEEAPRNDPYEMHNLANDPAYDGKLKELRHELYKW